MKLWMKICGVIALSLMCVFTSVGYAAITSNMTITGTAQVAPPEKLFISHVSGGGYIDESTLAYADTVVTSDVTLKNGVAEYEITVFNNTPDTYYYLAMVRGTYTSTDGGQTVAYSNDNITMSVEGFARGDAVPAGTQKTFTVRASFKSGADTSDPSLFSIVEYRFSTTKPDSSDEAAISGVLSRFPEVLNSDDYDKLTAAMADTNGRLNASYIGNVVGATGEDTRAIVELFGDTLVLNIDGKDVPVTVMIKASNVDGNTGTCDQYSMWGNRSGGEMTLYITADPLTSAGQKADVYALVYTMDQATGEWYLLGETYRGRASIKGYSAWTTTGTGSFYTDDWASVAKTYKVTDNYSYSIGATSINNIVQAKDANANAELRRLIQEAKNIVDSGEYFAEQVEALQSALEKYAKYYTANANGTVSISGDPTRAEIVPVIKDLDNLLKNFR